MKDMGSVRIAVVHGEWYSSYVEMLCDDALEGLREAGVAEKNIELHSVPGAFEIPLLVSALAKRVENPCAALVALGIVIRGETPHFHYLSKACINGLMQITLETGKPVGLGVLTVEGDYQVEVRARNTGKKAAQAALTMLERLAEAHGN